MTIIEYSKLDDQELLRPEQVSEWLKVSKSFLDKGRHFGTGPTYIKLRGSVRYRKGAIDAWIAENERTRVRSMGFVVSFDDGDLPSPEEIELWLVGERDD